MTGLVPALRRAAGPAILLLGALRAFVADRAGSATTLAAVSMSGLVVAGAAATQYSVL